MSAIMTPGIGFRAGCGTLTGVPESCTASVAPKQGALNQGLSRMKGVGFLLLLAGWFLVLAAIAMFPAAPARMAFVLIGIAVEGLGLGFAFRSHLIPREDKQ
jgi:hypothetical protein